MNKARKFPKHEQIDSHKLGNYLDKFERNLEPLGYFQNFTLVYSSTVMSNVSDTKLKEWVVVFWKEGRLTPRKLLKDQKGVDRVWAWMKKFALNLASKGPICGFTTKKTFMSKNCY